MEHVAELSYANKDYLLFFRGQGRDYKNKAGASSFRSTIYRGERLPREELALRFDVLSGAAAGAWSKPSIVRGLRARGRSSGASTYIEAFLQHYEV